MGNPIWLDSFHYTSSELSQFYTTTNVTVGAFGRNGARGLEQNQDGSLSATLNRVLGSARDTWDICFGLDLYSGLPGAGRMILQLVENTTKHVTFMLNSTGSIQAYRGGTPGGGGTSLGTSSSNLPTVGYPHVEFQVKVHDSTGFIKVWINEVLVLDLSSQDTRNGGTAGLVDNIRLFGDTVTFESLKCRIADLIVHEDTQQGDLWIATLDPDSNGDSSQFLGSDGNNTDNYLLVTKSSPNLTTHVLEDTAGQEDLYNFQSLTSGAAVPKFIAIHTWDQKTDAGTCTYRHKLKRGGSTAESADISPGTAAAYHYSIHVNDPNSGSPFTNQNITDLQVGQKRQT